MVLEALVAVGLAGNIVQFVAFSCQLLGTATSIQRSHAGASSDVHDIESVTKALQQWCKKLDVPGHSPLHQPALQPHADLLKLAKDCQSTATKLLSATEKLKAKNPHSKWSSFRAALASKWREEEIKDMERRLDSYRHQIALEIAVLDRYVNLLGGKNFLSEQ
jgi:hypothetical protein